MQIKTGFSGVKFCPEINWVFHKMQIEFVTRLIGFALSSKNLGQPGVHIIFLLKIKNIHRVLIQLKWIKNIHQVIKDAVDKKYLSSY